MALVPNKKQRELIEKNGYDANYWLVEYEDAMTIVIIHKESKETHTLIK